MRRMYCSSSFSLIASATGLAPGGRERPSPAAPPSGTLGPAGEDAGAQPSPAGVPPVAAASRTGSHGRRAPRTPPTGADGPVRGDLTPSPRGRRGGSGSLAFMTLWPNQQREG